MTTSFSELFGIPLPVARHLGTIVRRLDVPGRSSDMPQRQGDPSALRSDETYTGGNTPALPETPSATTAATGAHPSRTLVVQAPPGTGKTTLIPPLLAHHLQGTSAVRVVVTQPRRVAARAAAQRIAALLGEELGERIGYTIRGESKRSRHTIIEMVTPGVLLRRLQQDPELPGVGAVILDEVHERQLDSDLALAFCRDVQRSLREDLFLIAMSATADTARLVSVLEAEAVEIPGAAYPVETRWAVPTTAASALGSLGGATGVRREFLAHVAQTVRRALSEVPDGDVLAFLPGVREVNEVAAQLSDCGAQVMRLHGSLPAAEQDRVIRGRGDRHVSGRPLRRVVVTTAVAESSLTVPGVRVVVDAGLSREPRLDYARGVGGLVTVRESRASGIQRSGRAGREAPGVVYRCMDQATWARLPEQSAPEIQTADLTDFALQVACWGTPGGEGLALLDTPPAAAVEAATRTLENLNALVDGRPTPLGRRLAELPVEPRVGRALLEACARIGATSAADICALLSEELRLPGADLTREWRHAVHGDSWRAQARRLRRIIAQQEGGNDNAGRAAQAPYGDMAEEEWALVVSLAYPERVARLREPSSGVRGTNRSGQLDSTRTAGRRYLLANGMGAVLPEGSPLTGEPWLAIAYLDRPQGRADASIRSAVPIGEAEAVAAARALLVESDDVVVRRNRLRTRHTRQLGAIELAAIESDLAAPELARSFLPGAIAGGDITLEWSRAARELQQRLAFLHEVIGEPWPAVDDHTLLGDSERWLAPEMDEAAHHGTVPSVGVNQLRRILPWPAAARLDELAPEKVMAAGGATIRVDYSDARPLIRLRVQEAFGWGKTLRVADGRIAVTVELLSPAGRPVAVTDDLASFWNGAYAQVRAEMRGRYPRHAWPEDPLHAEPPRHGRRAPRDRPSGR